MFLNKMETEKWYDENGKFSHWQSRVTFHGSAAAPTKGEAEAKAIANLRIDLDDWEKVEE